MPAQTKDSHVAATDFEAHRQLAPAVEHEGLELTSQAEQRQEADEDEDHKSDDAPLLAAEQGRKHPEAAEEIPSRMPWTAWVLLVVAVSLSGQS